MLNCLLAVAAQHITERSKQIILNRFASCQVRSDDALHVQIPFTPAGPSFTGTTSQLLVCIASQHSLCNLQYVFRYQHRACNHLFCFLLAFPIFGLHGARSMSHSSSQIELNAKPNLDEGGIVRRGGPVISRKKASVASLDS